MRLLTNFVKKSFKTEDNTKIYYEITGDPQKNHTLLFVHGLGGDLAAWDKERQYFSSKNYATVALDLRGHGLSQRLKNVGDYTLEKFSHDIADLIRYEKLENCVLVGHCFGGIVTLVFAANHLEKIKALILVDTSYQPPQFSKFVAKNYLIQLFLLAFAKLPLPYIHGHANFGKFIGTKDFDKRRIFSDIIHTSLQSYILISKNLISFDGKPLLKKINLSTLIIEGEADSIFPPEIAEELHKQIRTSELDFIPDANHILVLNNPEELSEKIERFCKGIFK